MKDSFYFSHDYNSRTDSKIKKLLAKHGMAGYGVFWSIVEDLYNNANALQMDTESIAYDLRVECDFIKSILTDFDLFVIKDGIISSKSVQDRIEKRTEKSLKASESAKARWDKSNKTTNEMRTHTEGNANKGKERKGKEKEINISFDAFWDLYALKKDRTESEKIWQKLTDEERELAMKDIPAYKSELSDLKYQKHPSTYLHQKTWRDRQTDSKSKNESNLSDEAVIEREKRRKKYEATVRGEPYRAGNPMKFDDNISLYHKQLGFYNDLR